jgi:hypothetical protein
LPKTDKSYPAQAALLQLAHVGVGYPNIVTIKIPPADGRLHRLVIDYSLPI